jgi:cation diffusion facilitator CzcD-associated flavoprotein CzcO
MSELLASCRDFWHHAGLLAKLHRAGNGAGIWPCRRGGGKSPGMSDDILDMAIIGAGISGIGMAASLARELPDKRFVVLERRARLGGTWDVFRYPGVRSDSDMYTLGYSFAPWPSGRAIGEGAAIRDYLEQVARDCGVWPHIRTGAQVLSADWDSAAQCWTLAMTQGPTVRARFVFCGAGYYDADSPYQPAIAGLDSFSGRVVHPQFWPEDLDYAGQRVAVIGSGATAVTVVPAMARVAAHVTMIQRTPSWYLVMPSRDRFATLLRRWLPARIAHRIMRARNVRLQALFYNRCRTDPAGMGEWLAGNVRQALGPAWDPRHFTPPYPPWEQRLCLTPDADLFRAIRKGAASMATGAIARVEP